MSFEDYTMADAKADERQEKISDEIHGAIKKTVSWIEANVEAFAEWGYLGFTSPWDSEWKLLAQELEMDIDPEDGITANTKEIFEMWVRLLISEGIYPMDEDGNRLDAAPPIPKV